MWTIARLSTVGARAAGARRATGQVATPARSLSSLSKPQLRTSLPLRSAAPASSCLHTRAPAGLLRHGNHSGSSSSASSTSHPSPAAAAAEGRSKADSESKQQQHQKQEQQQQHKKSTSRWKRAATYTLVAASAATAYGVYLMRDEETKSWQLMVWKTLPLRFFSYLWGSVHRLELPVSFRAPLYKAWTRVFDCKLDEILGADSTEGGGVACLDDFPNLNSFFIRRIDLARCRPIDPQDLMVSPVDGRVNVFGEVTAQGKVEQIKGMEYAVEDLLGHPLPPPKVGSKYMYYVLYLAPGDYHRMHSPADCVIAERRHFPGALYPVAPSIATYIPSLFVRNERVVLSGSWAQGFFAMVPVGAYNVGSMKLTFDEELDTNLRAHTFTQYRPNIDDGLKSKPFFKNYKRSAETQQEVLHATDAFVKSDPAVDPDTFTHAHHAHKHAAAGGATLAATAGVAPEIVPSGKTGVGCLSPSARSQLGAASAHLHQPVPRVSSQGIHLAKGDEFSRFELGSTIVVIFEVDKGQTFNWNIEPEQKIKLGQRIGVMLPATKGKQ